MFLVNSLEQETHSPGFLWDLKGFKTQGISYVDTARKITYIFM
jgi:hypothetical protein